MYFKYGTSYFEIIPFRTSCQKYLSSPSLQTLIFLSSSVTNYGVITSNGKGTQLLSLFLSHIIMHTRTNIVSCRFLILNIIGIVLRFAYLFLPLFIFIQSHVIHLFTSEVSLQISIEIKTELQPLNLKLHINKFVH